MSKMCLHYECSTFYVYDVSFNILFLASMKLSDPVLTLSYVILPNNYTNGVRFSSLE